MKIRMRNGSSITAVPDGDKLVGCSSAVERLPVKQVVEGSIPSAPGSPGTNILRAALYDNALVLVQAHLLLNHPRDIEDCDCEVARLCRQTYTSYEEMPRG